MRLVGQIFFDLVLFSLSVVCVLFFIFLFKGSPDAFDKLLILFHQWLDSRIT